MNNINLIPNLAPSLAPSLAPLYPEIFLLIAASAILLIDMFLSDKNRYLTYLLSLATLAGCAALTWCDFQAGLTVFTFNDMFVSDPMGHVLKLMSYLACALTFVYARRYSTERGMLGQGLGGEFYVLALFTLLGQMVMISGSNLLIIYLGLELMSLCLYALVALRRDHVASTEASMKYFILGALASGFLLYGMSMIYGATGHLDLHEIEKVASSASGNKTILVFGLVFLVAGLGFKLGTVPFHMWVPDVYQGAPTGVTLLLGGAPKLAAFAICFRILIDCLSVIGIEWQQMLMIMAVLSIGLGNLAAIAQTNIKRMLGYSTISHMGFVLLGLAVGMGPNGSTTSLMLIGAYGAAMFYVVSYVLTTLGTFGMVMYLSRSGFEAEEVSDFKGLAHRSPWFALIMLLLMFSLAGIPPLLGFQSKFLILKAVVESNQIWLAVFAVVFSLVGAFYYLRIVKLMYFDEPTDKNPIIANTDMRLTLSVNGLAVLLLGLFPNGLMLVCSIAIGKTLAA
jgi:NADH-quinone oxidoreductase subunit N